MDEVGYYSMPPITMLEFFFLNYYIFLDVQMLNRPYGFVYIRLYGDIYVPSVFYYLVLWIRSTGQLAEKLSTVIKLQD